MSIELVMIASNELRYVRTQLALLKKVDPGIKIDSVTVINQNGFLEEEHQYLKSRKDINRVLDYRSPGKFMEYDPSLDLFIKMDSCTDYVLFMHPDCFPIKDGWGKLLYDRAIESKIAGCIWEENATDPNAPCYNEIVLQAATFMVDTKFLRNNVISLQLCSISKNEPIIKYKDYDIGVCHINRIDRYYDVGTMACVKSLSMGKDPFLPIEVFNTYFEHCQHGTLLLNSKVHPQDPYPKYPDIGIKYGFIPLYNIYFNEKYSNLKIKNILKYDKCPVSLKKDRFTELHNLKGF